MNTSLLNYSLSDWHDYVAQHKFPSYRSKQIFEWIHRQKQFSPELFTNLPQGLIQQLKLDFPISDIHVKNIESSTENTVKYIWEFASKKAESVWLPYPNRQSACISVQSGCSLDCSFCATGKLPFKGNLSSGEILFQVYSMEKLQKKNITNVVYMGMGEPFYNYESCIRSASILCDENGKNLSHRKVTMSTSGVLPKIEKFVLDQEPYSLAISVHSLQNNVRSQLMDIEKKYPIQKVVQFLNSKRHLLKKKQLTIEYILIKNINMNDLDVDLLVNVAKKIQAKVNLIPLNTTFSNLERPSTDEMKSFQEKLQKRGVIAINRLSPGLEIQAACGMLANQEIQKEA